MRKPEMLLGLLATLILTLPAASQELHHNDGTHHHHHEQSQAVAHDGTNALAHHVAGDDDHPCTQHVDGSDLEHPVLTAGIVHHDGDSTAISDMRAFAAGRYGGAQERPETFGAAAHWTHDWELRWADFDVSDHQVRLYHLTSMHDHTIRYVCAADHDHGHVTEWQPFH